MPSAMPTSRRRSRDDMTSDGGDDDNDDNDDAPSRSSSADVISPPQAKRMRITRSPSSTESSSSSSSAFQPGAIVRVKVENFVTYELAEFFPGPNLNMIIGPNGTGKSSLVCAICLGLGWGPQQLGRATQMGEFVKHGQSEAVVEIELQGFADQSNPIIRLKITRNDNKREFALNRRITTHKAIQNLMQQYSIQVDNLCQFLPQDKVSEFAAMSPVDLLDKTLRAAGSEQMTIQHGELKRLRMDEKKLRQDVDQDEAHLRNLEHRQDNLQTEVQQLRERNEVAAELKFLQRCVPFAEYKTKHEAHLEHRSARQEANRKYKQLEQQVAPTLEAVNKKKTYRDQIAAAIRTRKIACQSAEREADLAVQHIEKYDQDLVENGAEVENEKKAEGNRKAETNQLEVAIRDLKAKLEQRPDEFDPVTWNEAIRAKETEKKGFDRQMAELSEKRQEFLNTGSKLKETIARLKRELQDFDTQAGQDLEKVAAKSKDTARAWQWVLENQDKFEKEVFGPPLITCSLKDARYADVAEQSFNDSSWLILTTQTRNDYKLLAHEVFDVRKLSKVTLRCVTDDMAELQRRLPQPVAEQQLQNFGLDTYASECINAPEPVMVMLCEQLQLHRTAIGLRNLSQAQFDSLAPTGLKNYVAGDTQYNVVGRADLGPAAMSTKTSSVKTSSVFTNSGPVDNSEKQRVQAQLQEKSEQFDEIRIEVGKLQEQTKALEAKSHAAKDEIADLNAKKAEKQKAYGQWKAIPQKLEVKQQILAKKLEQRQEFHETLARLDNHRDLIVIRKAGAVLAYKDTIAGIRSCRHEYLTASIMLIEADSDIAALKKRNEGVHLRLAQEQAKAQEAEREAKNAKVAAQRALELCRNVLAEDDIDEAYQKRIHANERGVEELANEIRAQENRLEYMHVGNTNAIHDYEARQAEISRLQDKMQGLRDRIEACTGEIQGIQEAWEPELDRLVAEISEAFAYNFEQIGCAGEVGIHKDEDFENWAIQIKVKFRENETLQILDAHRQSGGERSVSTIFYLMSLQSLARAPFRVVDEINQGMDQRNERMVHGRMVQIACAGEHTSQYFLITPKLLTGLRYDRRMKVLCIASGQYMPGVGGGGEGSGTGATGTSGHGRSGGGGGGGGGGVNAVGRIDIDRIIGIKRRLVAGVA